MATNTMTDDELLDKLNQHCDEVTDFFEGRKVPYAMFLMVMMAMIAKSAMVVADRNHKTPEQMVDVYAGQIKDMLDGLARAN